MRLIGAVLFEQNDEWQTASRYMMVEAFAQIDKEEIDPILSITTESRLHVVWRCRHCGKNVREGVRSTGT